MTVKDFNKWAKVYDIIDADVKKDIPFYINQAKKAKGKVLDIGCGTGRIYLELLKNNIEAYGIDISSEMLKILKKKAKKIGVLPKVHNMSMDNFKLNHKFKLIILPFNSFRYAINIKEQIKTLKLIKKHLAPKGKFIFDIYYPDPNIIIRALKRSKSKEKLKTKEGTYEIKEEFYFEDFINQINVVDEKIYKKGRLIGTAYRKGVIIYKREMELLLMLAGFKKLKVYGGLKKEKLVSHKQKMVWIVE